MKNENIEKILHLNTGLLTFNIDSLIIDQFSLLLKIIKHNWIY